MPRRRGRRLLFRLGFVAIAAAIGGSLLARQTASPSFETLPDGFEDQVVLEGLRLPISFALSPDGRVFVGEQSGRIVVYPRLGTGQGRVVADLSDEVHAWSERGLLDIALHPEFPETPSLYALYTYDARIGEKAPLWGTPGKPADPCPGLKPPRRDGCVASGRLTRLTVASGRAVDRKVLIEDWCIQFNTHAVGALAFDRSGALYVSAGDGAYWENTDYGQLGTPANPCGDPPAGAGRKADPAVAEGGSLRAQSPLRPRGQQTTLDGTVIRVDPETGAAMPDNPRADASDANLRRIVAFGFKNPFKIALEPSGDALWVGDVGHDAWEEINRVPLGASTQLNFGWPCYEGDDRQTKYNVDEFQIAETGRCHSLYDLGQDAVEKPYWSYPHYLSFVPGDGCPTAGGAISGLAFYTGSRYPAEYRDALFFSDFTRSCIWMLPRGSEGQPSPPDKRRFRWNARTPVALEAGYDGDLFYLDYAGGELHRIVYRGGS